ncbi:hypothetical protein ACWGFX_01435 [Streptomyces xanthophaeus]
MAEIEVLGPEADWQRSAPTFQMTGIQGIPELLPPPGCSGRRDSIESQGNGSVGLIATWVARQWPVDWMVGQGGLTRLPEARSRAGSAP